MAWLEIFILVFSFVVLMTLGVPIAFCLGVAAVCTMLVSIDPVPAVTTVAQRMATGLDSFALLAIPFFILAGQLMNRGGIARRLIDFAKTLVAVLPGGLAHVNILAAMLFGAISGSSVAAASAVGGVMAPRMEEEGYDRGFGAAVNITSATTGLIIPPSNILIVYSLASGGVSIAALFLAGYLPGILVGLALMVVAGVIAWRRGYPRAERLRPRLIVRRGLEAFPSLFMLVLVIGGIVAGIFTATEASAVAVVYAFVLAMIYREVRLADVPGILLETVKTTAIVMLLIGTSMGLSWVMAYENIPQNVTEGLIGLAESPLVILLIINLILLAVGTFMDMTPAVLIFTPIFLPIVTELGMDPTHFGIVMVLNLCVGLCTPPVGSVLFVGCGIAGVPITRVVRPLLPLFAAMIVALLIVTYVPWLSLWLPRVFGF
ncbi:TRAP transporter large permease [Rhodocaloribacter litoris]|uniref:TRAP transporter large permease n=1 Tax=Rhodocaloribacter litoris TaxID=2558931 RepID=UPI0014246868|nr:TRAP transporter large permease [Rhodocaloribacter litoris]QXD14452.1 TRAP transporter large permease [Rhodocaloribacter litoris]